MDYLDPKKKRNKKIRLMIGYALLGVAISIATVVFVYLANGYYIDRETGVVIQNGLVFLDSKPESATIYINGEQQRGSTDARLVVPEGSYDIELRRDGYVTWGRKLSLEGGSLRRLTYARLFPEKLDSEVALNLSLPALPQEISQSIDKRWLVMAFAGQSQSMQFVDLNRTVLQIEELPIPPQLIKSPGPGVWKIVEWADDNKTFLAEFRSDAAITEYVLINRDDPSASKNLADAFPGQRFSSALIRDRKNDLVFLNDATTGEVFRGDVKSGAVESYVKNVTDYVSFGSDAMLYVTDVDASEGHVKAVLKKGDEQFTLREIKANVDQSKDYLLEMAKLGNSLVMGIGSATEGRVIVYNDPIGALKNNDFSSLPVPTTVLRVADPEELSISADSSVIMARSGLKFASHEFEDDRSYTFEIDAQTNASQNITWIDGQHFMMPTGINEQTVADFDGSNVLKLANSQPELGSIFDGSLDEQFTFLPAAEVGSPVRIMRTFMRTEADR